MNIKRVIYTLALAAGVFLSAGCFPSRQKEETIVFPFFNGIYSYSPVSGILSIKNSTACIFSKSFHIKGNTGWFSGSTAGSNTRKALIKFNLKNNSIKEILNGQYQRIIPLPGYVIAVSLEYYAGRGFLYEFYSLNNTWGTIRKLYSAYIDLFISDVENVSGILVAAGYDRSGENNLLIRIDPLHEAIKRLSIQKRNSDFLKLIPTGKELICYPSSQDWKEKGEIFFRHLTYSQLSHPDSYSAELVLSRVHIPAGKFVLFGKGFFRQDKLYLPVLDKEYNTGLLEIRLYDPALPFALLPLLTGLYIPVSINPGLKGSGPVFLGYNYYKDQDQFYFMILPSEISPDTWNDVLYLPLNTGNS